MSKITNNGLIRSGTGCYIAVPTMATVGVKELREWTAEEVGLQVDGKTLLSIRVPRDIRTALIVTHVVVLAFLYVCYLLVTWQSLSFHRTSNHLVVSYRIVLPSLAVYNDCRAACLTLFIHSFHSSLSAQKFRRTQRKAKEQSWTKKVVIKH